MGEPRVEQPGGLIYYLEMQQFVQWGKYIELEELGGYMPKDEGKDNHGHGHPSRLTKLKVEPTADEQWNQLNAIVGRW